MVREWWKLVAGILFLLAAIVFIGYVVMPGGFGFSQQEITDTINATGTVAGVETETTIVVDRTLPAKNLWDLLDLVIVSFVIAFGVVLLEQREKKRHEARQDLEDARQQNNQRESTLQDYYDRMSELILEKQLGQQLEQESEGSGVEDIQQTTPEDVKDKTEAIAKARTLAVLRVLDPNRVSAVFHFLREVGLLDTISLAEEDLHQVDWRGAHLVEINLSKTDLSGATLNTAILDKAKLNRTDLSDANLIETKLRGAEMITANLEGAKLNRANLTSADMTGAKLEGADLSGAVLRDVNLEHADLRGADLTNADLEEADLEGAELYGADLSGANLSEANLYETKYNTTTRWPASINLEAEGATLLEEEN